MTGYRLSLHPYLSIAVVMAHYAGWGCCLFIANLSGQDFGLVLVAYLVFVAPLIMSLQARGLKAYRHVSVVFRTAYFASAGYLWLLGGLIVWALIGVAMLPQ